MFNEHTMAGFVSLTPDYNTYCSEIYSGVTLPDCAIDGDREYPSTTIRRSDMINETDQKGDEAMSFVGMLLFNDKIIAFGDTKPTISTVLGTLKEDTRRGKIDKVFSRGEYVLTTFNNNRFCTMANDGNTWCNIEDWLKINIPKYSDYHFLLQHLCETIKPGTIPSNNAIMFMIGSMENGICFIQTACVFSGGVTYFERGIGSDLYVNGYDYYLKKKEAIINELQEYDHTVPLPGYLKTIIEEHIKNADKYGSYNPAGCPVNVIEWRPRSTT